MRRSSPLLIVSLMANAVAIGLICFTSAKHSEWFSHRDGRGGEPAELKWDERAIEVNRQPGSARSTGTSKTKLWSLLQADDLKTLVGRLRAAGFPEDLVEAIVFHRINGMWTEHNERYRKQEVELPFWRTRSFSGTDLEELAELRRFDRATDRLADEALGEKGAMFVSSMKSDEWRLAFLSPEKRLAYQRFQSAYLRQSLDDYDIQEKPGTRSDKEEKDAWNREQKQRDADLAQILSPSELQEYRLRESPMANNLRSELKYFSPSEAEYRVLFPLYDQASQTWRDQGGGQGKSYGDMVKELRATNEAQIKQLLGPDRYADFQQANDPDAKKLNLITERLGLPLSAATEVTKVQKDVTQLAQMIQEDTSLTPEQCAQKLSDLQTETQAAITQSLGEAGFSAYKEYSGSWMAKLAPLAKDE